MGVVAGIVFPGGGRHHCFVPAGVCDEEDIARCLGQPLFEKLGTGAFSLAGARVFIEGKEVTQRL